MIRSGAIYSAPQTARFISLQNSLKNTCNVSQRPGIAVVFRPFFRLKPLNRLNRFHSLPISIATASKFPILYGHPLVHLAVKSHSHATS